MTQENKELLLKDLCGRLPYGVIIKSLNGDDYGPAIDICYPQKVVAYMGQKMDAYAEDFLPYLRPLSSMTEEEKKSYHIIKDRLCEACIHGTIKDIAYWTNSLDLWFYKYHFDNANLIEKGLAIEVTEENNPYN